MGFARTSQRDFSPLKGARHFANGETPLSLDHVVDFVIIWMAVESLLLAGFYTIKVAEHSLAFKEIDLLHLPRVESEEIGDPFHIHRQIAGHYTGCFDWS